MNILQRIIEDHPDDEFYKADGFDDAVVGYCGDKMVLIYSVSKIMDILMAKGLSYEEADEHLYHNIMDGCPDPERKPIFMHDDIIGADDPGQDTYEMHPEDIITAVHFASSTIQELHDADEAMMSEAERARIRKSKRELRQLLHSAIDDLHKNLMGDGKDKS